MAEETKPKETLAQTLDKITFKNETATKIAALQEQNKKLLAENIGKRKASRTSSNPATRIQGLQTIGNSLGTQRIETKKK